MRSNTYADSVRELQEWLVKLHYSGYPVELVFANGIYGQNTRRAVSEFQEYAGLKPDGVVDINTWNAIRDAYESVINGQRPPFGITPFPNEKGYKVGIGGSSDVVTILQIMLKDIAAFTDHVFDYVDGVFGEETKNAVSSFQKLSGIKPTGVVDKETWDALAAFYNQNNVGH